ncbi:MAG: cupin, partial [Verrucomicrobia bacterium]|nr:cupin [Verrucomicrobiota bacterium]
MLAHVHLKAGCVIPNHAHANEQVSYVLSGSLRFWVGDTVDSEKVEDSTVLR